MKQGAVYQSLERRCGLGQRSYWVLLDPDDFSPREGAQRALQAQEHGAHAVLIGGSLLYSSGFDSFVAAVKEAIDLPVLLFPGDATQLSRHADALLFLSLVSGRNPVNLIGEHVKAAPLVREMGIETIATAYLLVESGAVTSVEFMSNTRPIPRTKPGIAAAHALAAQYQGMALVYLEAGSGALQPVPADMVRLVKSQIDVPLVVGGGIRDAGTARSLYDAGADVLVTGNHLSTPDGPSLMRAVAALAAEKR